MPAHLPTSIFDFIFRQLQECGELAQMMLNTFYKDTWDLLVPLVEVMSRQMIVYDLRAFVS